MSETGKVFVGLVSTEVAKDEGDTYNQDGLLVCGVCGETKEAYWNENVQKMFGIRKHPRMCACKRKIRDAIYEEEKIAEEQAAVNSLWQYSLTDDRFNNSTFDKAVLNDFNAKVLKIARNYVENFDRLYKMNKGLLLYGQPGTGKTFIASCIANELLKRRVPILFTSIVKLTSASSPFSKDAEEQRRLLVKMNQAKVLFIDDLGTERDSDFKMEQLFEVIDSRYGAKKPMIITTNLSIAQMKEEKDLRKRRVYERIFEVCHPVQVTGASWRLEKAKRDYKEIDRILMGE